MESDVFSLGETWLHPGAKFNFEGFDGHFSSYGYGKGVAAFVKFELSKTPHIFASEYLSVIKLSKVNMDLIFVYISQKCQKQILINVLKDLIDINNPTIVIGDFNEDYSNSSLVSMALKTMDFHQQVDESTHDKGHVIDHLYVNQKLRAIGFFTEKKSAYYSDHDILSIYVQQ